MAISNNYSDINAGVHQGLLNVSFMAQMHEFADLAPRFTNDGLQAMATAANETLQGKLKVIEAVHLEADPSALAKPSKRAGPPMRNNNFKLIKVPTPSPTKP
jgi:hypothetical protein